MRTLILHAQNQRLVVLFSARPSDATVTCSLETVGSVSLLPSGAEKPLELCFGRDRALTILKTKAPFLSPHENLSPLQV